MEEYFACKVKRVGKRICKYQFLYWFSAINLRSFSSSNGSTNKTSNPSNFQDKASKLFPWDYNSKASSQDIEMNKKFIVYNIYSNRIQRNYGCMVH